MSRSHRHPCGCRSTDSEWVEMCAACTAEFQERHHRAHTERKQSMGIKDDKAQASQSASFPKAAPTTGAVTGSGVPCEARP